jgi:hypothetical protein
MSLMLVSESGNTANISSIVHVLNSYMCARYAENTLLFQQPTEKRYKDSEVVTLVA